MFRPLAWTKTLARRILLHPCHYAGSGLMVLFIRGRLRPENANPISRFTQAIYLPVLRFCLKYRKLTIALNLIFLLARCPLRFTAGKPVHAAAV